MADVGALTRNHVGLMMVGAEVLLKGRGSAPLSEQGRVRAQAVLTRLHDVHQASQDGYAGALSRALEEDPELLDDALAFLAASDNYRKSPTVQGLFAPFAADIARAHEVAVSRWLQPATSGVPARYPVVSTADAERIGPPILSLDELARHVRESGKKVIAFAGVANGFHESGQADVLKLVGDLLERFNPAEIIIHVFGKGSGAGLVLGAARSRGFETQQLAPASPPGPVENLALPDGPDSGGDSGDLDAADVTADLAAHQGVLVLLGGDQDSKKLARKVLLQNGTVVSIDGTRDSSGSFFEWTENEIDGLGVGARHLFRFSLLSGYIPGIAERIRFSLPGTDLTLRHHDSASFVHQENRYDLFFEFLSSPYAARDGNGLFLWFRLGEHAGTALGYGILEGIAEIMRETKIRIDRQEMTTTVYHNAAYALLSVFQDDWNPLIQNKRDLVIEIEFPGGTVHKILARVPQPIASEPVRATRVSEFGQTVVQMKQVGDSVSVQMWNKLADDPVAEKWDPPALLVDGKQMTLTWDEINGAPILTTTIPLQGKHAVIELVGQGGRRDVFYATPVEEGKGTNVRISELTLPNGTRVHAERDENGLNILIEGSRDSAADVKLRYPDGTESRGNGDGASGIDFNISGREEELLLLLLSERGDESVPRVYSRILIKPDGELAMIETRRLGESHRFASHPDNYELFVTRVGGTQRNNPDNPDVVNFILSPLIPENPVVGLLVEVDGLPVTYESMQNILSMERRVFNTTVSGRRGATIRIYSGRDRDRDRDLVHEDHFEPLAIRNPTILTGPPSASSFIPAAIAAAASTNPTRNVPPTLPLPAPRGVDFFMAGDLPDSSVLSIGSAPPDPVPATTATDVPGRSSIRLASGALLEFEQSPAEGNVLVVVRYTGAGASDVFIEGEQAASGHREWRNEDGSYSIQRHYYLDGRKPRVFQIHEKDSTHEGRETGVMTTFVIDEEGIAHRHSELVVTDRRTIVTAEHVFKMERAFTGARWDLPSFCILVNRKVREVGKTYMLPTVKVNGKEVQWSAGGGNPDSNGQAVFIAGLPVGRDDRLVVDIEGSPDPVIFEPTYRPDPDFPPRLKASADAMGMRVRLSRRPGPAMRKAGDGPTRRPGRAEAIPVVQILPIPGAGKLHIARDNSGLIEFGFEGRYNVGRIIPLPENSSTRIEWSHAPDELAYLRAGPFREVDAFYYPERASEPMGFEIQLYSGSGRHARHVNAIIVVDRDGAPTLYRCGSSSLTKLIPLAGQLRSKSEQHSILTRRLQVRGRDYVTVELPRGRFPENPDQIFIRAERVGAEGSQPYDVPPFHIYEHTEEGGRRRKVWFTHFEVGAGDLVTIEFGENKPSGRVWRETIQPHAPVEREFPSALRPVMEKAFGRPDGYDVFLGKCYDFLHVSTGRPRSRTTRYRPDEVRVPGEPRRSQVEETPGNRILGTLAGRPVAAALQAAYPKSPVSPFANGGGGGRVGTPTDAGDAPEQVRDRVASLARMDEVLRAAGYEPANDVTMRGTGVPYRKGDAVYFFSVEGNNLVGLRAREDPDATRIEIAGWEEKWLIMAVLKAESHIVSEFDVGAGTFEVWLYGARRTSWSAWNPNAPRRTVSLRGDTLFAAQPLGDDDHYRYTSYLAIVERFRDKARRYAAKDHEAAAREGRVSLAQAPAEQVDRAARLARMDEVLRAAGYEPANDVTMRGTGVPYRKGDTVYLFTIEDDNLVGLRAREDPDATRVEIAGWEEKWLIMAVLKAESHIVGEFDVRAGTFEVWLYGAWRTSWSAWNPNAPRATVSLRGDTLFAAQPLGDDDRYRYTSYLAIVERFRDKARRYAAEDHEAAAREGRVSLWPRRLLDNPAVSGWVRMPRDPRKGRQAGERVRRSRAVGALPAPASSAKPASSHPALVLFSNMGREVTFENAGLRYGVQTFPGDDILTISVGALPATLKDSHRHICQLLITVNDVGATFVQSYDAASDLVRSRWKMPDFVKRPDYARPLELSISFPDGHVELLNIVAISSDVMEIVAKVAGLIQIKSTDLKLSASEITAAWFIANYRHIALDEHWGHFADLIVKPSVQGRLDQILGKKSKEAFIELVKAAADREHNYQGEPIALGPAYRRSGRQLVASRGKGRVGGPSDYRPEGEDIADERVFGMRGVLPRHRSDYPGRRPFANGEINGGGGGGSINGAQTSPRPSPAPEPAPKADAAAKLARTNEVLEAAGYEPATDATMRDTGVRYRKGDTVYLFTIEGDNLVGQPVREDPGGTRVHILGWEKAWLVIGVLKARGYEIVDLARATGTVSVSVPAPVGSIAEGKAAAAYLTGDDLILSQGDFVETIVFGFDYETRALARADHEAAAREGRVSLWPRRLLDNPAVSSWVRLPRDPGRTARRAGATVRRPGGAPVVSRPAALPEDFTWAGVKAKLVHKMEALLSDISPESREPRVVVETLSRLAYAANLLGLGGAKKMFARARKAAGSDAHLLEMIVDLESGNGPAIPIEKIKVAREAEALAYKGLWDKALQRVTPGRADILVRLVECYRKGGDEATPLDAAISLLTYRYHDDLDRGSLSSEDSELFRGLIGFVFLRTALAQGDQGLASRGRGMIQEAIDALDDLGRLTVESAFFSDPSALWSLLNDFKQGVWRNDLLYRFYENTGHRIARIDALMTAKTWQSALAMVHLFEEPLEKMMAAAFVLNLLDEHRGIGATRGSDGKIVSRRTVTAGDRNRGRPDQPRRFRPEAEEPVIPRMGPNRWTGMSPEPASLSRVHGMRVGDSSPAIEAGYPGRQNRGPGRPGYRPEGADVSDQRVFGTPIGAFPYHRAEYPAHRPFESGSGIGGRPVGAGGFATQKTDPAILHYDPSAGKMTSVEISPPHVGAVKVVLTGDGKVGLSQPVLKGSQQDMNRAKEAFTGVSARLNNVDLPYPLAGFTADEKSYKVWFVFPEEAMRLVQQSGRDLTLKITFPTHRVVQEIRIATPLSEEDLPAMIRQNRAVITAVANAFWSSLKVRSLFCALQSDNVLDWIRQDPTEVVEKDTWARFAGMVVGTSWTTGMTDPILAEILASESIQPFKDLINAAAGRGLFYPTQSFLLKRDQRKALDAAKKVVEELGGSLGGTEAERPGPPPVGPKKRHLGGEPMIFERGGGLPEVSDERAWSGRPEVRGYDEARVQAPRASTDSRAESIRRRLIAEAIRRGMTGVAKSLAVMDSDKMATLIGAAGNLQETLRLRHLGDVATLLQGRNLNHVDRVLLTAAAYTSSRAEIDRFVSSIRPNSGGASPAVPIAGLPAGTVPAMVPALPAGSPAALLIH